MRRTVPAVRTGQIDSRDVGVKQTKPRTLKSKGPADQALEPSIIEPAALLPNKDKLDALAFMEEPVTVMVHETTNVTDEQIPEVFVNGVVQRFFRGQAQTVKRKFVEKLARTKATRFTQNKVKDREGTETYQNVPHTSLRYPFSVIEDRNPKGASWLKATLEAQG